MTIKTLFLTLFATSLLATEPEKLTKLRGSYEAAITKATAPIQKTYTTELEKLKIEFTKAGKLEDALAVDEEIKKHIPEPKPTTESNGTKKSKDSAKELEEYLMSHVWWYSKDPDSRVGAYEIVFLPGGKFTQPDPAEPNTKNWFWSADRRGDFSINGVGPVNFKVGDKLIEHKFKESSRWLQLSETALPPKAQK